MGTYHLECFSRGICAFVLVGMSLQGHLLITFLHIFWRRITRDAEDLVVINEILMVHDDCWETVVCLWYMLWGRGVVSMIWAGGWRTVARKTVGWDQKSDSSEILAPWYTVRIGVPTGWCDLNWAARLSIVVPNSLASSWTKFLWKLYPHHETEFILLIISYCWVRKTSWVKL